MAILKPIATSKIIYLGTPQTEQSIYNSLPDRGYEIRIIPARYPTEAQRARYGDRLAQFIIDDLEASPELAGEPVCTRFSNDTLQKVTEQQRDEELQKELDKFMEQVVGDKYQAKTSLIDR